MLLPAERLRVGGVTDLEVFMVLAMMLIIVAKEWR